MTILFKIMLTLCVAWIVVYLADKVEENGTKAKENIAIIGGILTLLILACFVIWVLIFIWTM